MVNIKNKEVINWRRCFQTKGHADERDLLFEKIPTKSDCALGTHTNNLLSSVSGLSYSPVDILLTI